jgi:hypothetical protein
MTCSREKPFWIRDPTASRKRACVAAHGGRPESILRGYEREPAGCFSRRAAKLSRGVKAPKASDSAVFPPDGAFKLSGRKYPWAGKLMERSGT